MSLSATSTKKKFSIVMLLAVASYLLNPLFISKVQAVSLNQGMLRFDRMSIGVSDVDIVVMVEPQGAGDEDYVDVDFGAGITVDGTAANITTNTTGLPTGCTALDVGAAASAVSGQSVEFTISSPANPTTGTLYCFNITAGIDTPAGTGSIESVIRTEASGNAEIETTTVSNYFVDSGDDQVSVTAVVPPTFTFTLGANTTSFTTDLATNAVTDTTGVTGSIVTNAANGWTAYLRSTNGSLTSTVTGNTIDSQGTIDGAVTTISTADSNTYYQLAVTETTDNQTNGAPNAEYNDGSPAADEGGTFNDTALEPIASGTGATDSYVFTMVGKARVTGLTEAANDYSDTWTVVAAGNF